MSIEQELQTQNFESPQHKTALNIMFTATWLRNRTHCVFKEFGLSSEQFNVLRILRGQYPKSLCLKDITSRMLDRNSNTTRIVEKLVIKKWVQRSQSDADKRELQIIITQEGLDKLTQIDQIFEKERMHLTPILSDEECGLLNMLLDKMRE